MLGLVFGSAFVFEMCVTTTDTPAPGIRVRLGFADAGILTQSVVPTTTA